MRLFHCDERNFDLAFSIILLLPEHLPKTYTEAVSRIKDKKESNVAEREGIIKILKNYGFTEEEIKEIKEESVMRALMSPFEFRVRDFLEERIKLKFESIEEEKVERLQPLFLNLMRIEDEITKIEDTLEKIRKIEEYEEIERVESIFNEIVSLRLVKYGSEVVKWVRELARGLCSEVYDHALLTIIKIINLESINVLDALKILDALDSKNLLDFKQLVKTYKDYFPHWKDFIVFIFLLVHAQKIINYEEIINEIGLYRWSEYWREFFQKKEKEALLTLSKILLILLSLGSRAHARLALALATLVINNWEYRKNLALFEELCRSLISIGKYGDDEEIGKLLRYSYFYEDLDVIIKIGKLTAIEGSMKKALDKLRSQVKEKRAQRGFKSKNLRKT